MIWVVADQSWTGAIEGHEAALGAKLRRGHGADRRTGRVRVGIDQNGCSGLRVAHVKVVTAHDGICCQVRGAAEKGNEPSAGIHCRPITDRIGRHYSVHISAYQLIQSALAVPSRNTGSRSDSA